MKKLSVLAMLLMLIIISVSPAVAQDRTIITWFVGLGTGTDEQQIATQEQVAADFNASQDEIELVINIAPDYDVARDTISTLIAAGNAPDIVGPQGVSGGHAFAEQWADLTPFIEASGFDLSVYPDALVDLYRSGDEIQGIPFLVYPSLLYFNKNLFEEAGAEFPPQEFGADYTMPDGEVREWNYDTLRDLAMYMTVDANGADATMEEFDPESIVQFGLNFQWARQRLIWSDLQPEDWYDEETSTVTIPESWRTATQWLQDAIWVDHFIPSTTYATAEGFGAGGDNVFVSGNLAMSIVPLWFTCCMADSVGNFEFDFAVVPKSLDGEYHVATDADTFRMTQASVDAGKGDAAFTVLSYLQDEAAATLASAYGGYPALETAQDSYVEGLNERYPWGINTDVVLESLAYNNPGNMHHESWTANYQQGSDRVDAFNTLLFGDTGADVDVEAELDALESELNEIFGS